ncbi:hypothetical protein KGY79_10170 [Candidatus Bipolaricaulota bacterium]|nr:hypothetical protein [Candidatus Bipolaricaulota bacterium]
MKLKTKKALLIGLLAAFLFSFAFTALGSKTATQQLNATIIGSRSLKTSTQTVAGSAGSQGSPNNSFLLDLSYQSDYSHDMITVKAYEGKDAKTGNLIVPEGNHKGYNLLKRKKRQNAVIIWESTPLSTGTKDANVGEVKISLSKEAENPVPATEISEEKDFKVVYTVESA